MPLRRSLLTLAIAAGVVAAAAIASPALASTRASSAAQPGSMGAAFFLENGEDSIQWELKPVDALHAPIAGGRVHRTSAAAGGALLQMSATGLAAGVYTLQVVPMHGLLVLTKDGFSATTFTVRAGVRTGLGTVAAFHHVLTLRGNIPAGATVGIHEIGQKSWVSPDFTVERDGRYRFLALIPGTYSLEVNKTGYAPHTYTVLVREPHQDVTLGKKLG